MKLTASVIMRNEADRYLDPCLDALLEFCDEIRVLDDDSTDRGVTRRDPRVKVWRRPRNEGPAFQDHAAARNALLGFTLKGDPTWVLAIDADEIIDDGPQLRRACEQASTPVVTVNIREVWEACDELLCIREDGGWRSHEIGCVWRPDAFPAASNGIPDHGGATGRVPQVVHRGPARVSGASLLHLGWANRSDRAGRFARYSDGSPGGGHASAHVESIMWPPERVQLVPVLWPAMPAERRAALLERARLGEPAEA